MRQRRGRGLAEVFLPLPASDDVRDRARERRQMLGRALRGRCPLCGAPGIRRGWSGVAERCRGCNLRFSRERGYLVGAAWFNLTAALLAMAVVLVGGAALTAPDIPWTAVTSAAVATVAVTPVLFQPYALALWLWLDLAYFRGLDAEDLAANDPPREQP